MDWEVAAQLVEVEGRVLQLTESSSKLYCFVEVVDTPHVVRTLHRVQGDGVLVPRPGPQMKRVEDLTGVVKVEVSPRL